MTTKEMIEVMQAYERGEQIECRDLGTEPWYPVSNDPDWDNDPDWNMSDFEYRIKPKLTYRPYKNAQEFLQAQKEHGMNIRRKGCNYYRLPLYITDTLIGVQYPRSNGNIVSIDKSYEDLLREYTWQDGTPCGIEE